MDLFFRPERQKKISSKNDQSLKSSFHNTRIAQIKYVQSISCGWKTKFPKTLLNAGYTQNPKCSFVASIFCKEFFTPLT